MKRLYRLTDDKKIAGVCAGLGEYFDLDPVFFRLFFLVLVFFGGIGFVAYAAAWFLVPRSDAASEPRAASRLHLSATDRKVAGVCGGLGEFLDLDPVFIRIAFVVLACVGGIGIVLYAACWLVIPKDVGGYIDHSRSGGDVNAH